MNGMESAYRLDAFILFEELMSKAKAKNTVRKRTVKKEAVAPVSSVVNSNPRIQGIDFNPRALESVSGASSKDFKYQSETEPRLEEHMGTVQENAAYVEEHWKKRVKQEGKVYYTCPICTGASKIKAFGGKEAEKVIANHIKKEHPMRVKELKMKKANKAMYTPEKKIESPKRTLADAVHPKYRPQVEAQLRMQDELKPIRDQAKGLSVHGNALLKMVTMTESLAIQQLRTLSDKDLVAVVQLASNRGKRLLSRAARKMCELKKLNPDYATKDPSEKHMMIQQALQKAGSKVVLSRR